MHGHFLIMGGFVLTEPDSSTVNGFQGDNHNSRDIDPTVQWGDEVNFALDAVQASYVDHKVSTGDGGHAGQLSEIPRPALAKIHQQHRGGVNCDLPFTPQILHPELPRPPKCYTVTPHCSQASGHHVYPPSSSTVPPFRTQTSALSENQGHDPNRPWILTYEMLEGVLKINDLDFEIPITEAEIEDRSKGDFLAKHLGGLQVLWFIVHCFARLAQKLDLTQLELITLALASLNALMYGFWIDKPLNVAVPMKVNLKRRLTDEERKVVDFDARAPVSTGST